MNLHKALFPALILLTGGCLAVGVGVPNGANADAKGIASRLNFPYSDGWLGADDAYSIPFAADKSIWLFGDTFVGDAGTTLRSKAKTMVRNSVGVSTCLPNKGCTIRYYWRSPQAAKPRSFFDTGKDDEWYWPMDGYLYHDVLYVALMVVSNRPGAGPNDAFGFQIDGTRWAKVANPADPPDQWNISIKDLTQRQLWPGSSMVREGEFLLFYTQASQGEGKGYMIVLRVPLEKLDNPNENWAYLGKDRKWHAGTPADEAQHVIDQAISEMSVRYHPSTRKWVAISPGPEFPSKRIIARTADSPLGPWSKPQDIFEFPEMKPSNSGYDKNTFCYATKEHTEFDNSKVVVTYACNSYSIEKVTNNMQIYRPQVVVLEVPK
jgi:Domain of unknown function (DUF4185)